LHARPGARILHLMSNAVATHDTLPPPPAPKTIPCPAYAGSEDEPEALDVWPPDPDCIDCDGTGVATIVAPSWYGDGEAVACPCTGVRR
jgi:hypothetical protein